MEEITDFEASEEETAEEYAAEFNEDKPEEEDWPESWQQEKPAAFTLKYLGKSLELGQEETLSLAQKGLDYDRIRRERDSMKPRLSSLEGLLGALSRKSGMDEEQLLLEAQAENLQRRAEARGESLSYEDALARAETIPGEDMEELRRRESLLEFSRRFPDVKPESIPEEVWESFYGGAELSALYALEENGRLQARVRELEQRERNHYRSTGSRRSAGERSGSGIEDMWYAED